MSWQKNLRVVEPYVAGEQPKMEKLIKLNTNENPYGPSPKVIEAMNSIEMGKLRLYPDSDASALRDALAAYYKVDNSQVFIGNGSDEVLALAFLTYFNSVKPILFPDITYSFYPVYTELYNIKYQMIPLNDNYCMNIEDYKQENGGIIFPNPNAPTGILVNLSFIEEVLKANQESVVVVDEAYIDFGGESCIPLIEKYDNLVVVQTFSKSRSLAGLRIGVAIGSSVAIRALNDVKNSFNSYPVDMIAQKLALVSVEDSNDMKEKAIKIIKTREYTTSSLEELGFKVLPSYANFVFASHEDFDAKTLMLDLKKEGIIVRHFNKPRINQFLRITIGTQEQMEELISFLTAYSKG